MRLGESTDVLDHEGLMVKIAAPFAAIEKCPVRDSEAYSDVVAHFIRCRKTYDSNRGALFSSYAGNMARRVVYRNVKRRAFRSGIVGLGVDDQSYCSFDAGEIEDVDNADMMEEVREAMQQLDPRMRDVVERKLRRERFEDIAVVYRISKARVEQIHKKAVRNLREILVSSAPVLDAGAQRNSS